MVFVIASGDAATWVGSVAAVGALIAAVVAGWQATRLYHIERGRDQQAEIERQARAAAERRMQATRVTAWVATTTGTNAAGEDLGPAVLGARSQRKYEAAAFTARQLVR
jgi:hypothetical protein